MPPKSIFRQPGAKHFQLVHRSQRDPLIHDPDASQHVLKPFERENAKKGKSRADLESLLSSSELAHDKDARVGEAALYGIYYDDTEYDYMQHLRTVGVQEDGVESVLIEAPSASKSQTKKSKGIEMRDLPPEVLASNSELPRTYESQQAIPESIAGFQPDMDPHLRQVLEALDNEAFIDEGLEDDFFGELIGNGERGSDEEVDFIFEEDGVSELREGEEQNVEGTSWEERFAQFKKSQQGTDKQFESDSGSEGGDTIGELPAMAMSVIGGKKRRKGTSDASGYSMSSSSMYRNEALQILDERFDQMVLKQYNEDSGEVDPSSDDESTSDEVPELITSREDFESMMDEFLNDYEILGRKMKPKLAGETGVEKLDTIRRAMGQDGRVIVESDNDNDNEILMSFDIEDKKDRWDCETILTTYSNLENHPRLIRARDSKPVPKILLDPKTGMPRLVDSLHTSLPKTKPNRTVAKKIPEKSDNGSCSESDGEYIQHPARPHTIVRPRNESKEEKRARKTAVKAERKTRRADKKATKEEFDAEMKVQTRVIGNKEQRLKKL